MSRVRLPRQTLLRHLLIAVVLGVAAYLVTFYLSPFDDLRVAAMAYYFVALAGLTVLTGLSGQISLGHGALMAVGAYTSAILISRDGWALVPALVAATVVTAIAGALVGVVAARLRGPYLAGATLAFAVGLPGLADKYPHAFGGENGLTVNPPIPPTSLGANFPLE
ncbi:MAG: livM, partial [Solirubrobacteraceae bacterium]|nr:livM [Solirubrobacteraceae bacterium]